MDSVEKTLLAGLDIGTTGCKITVYAQDGEYLGRVYQEYRALRNANEHEIDATEIWQAVQQVLLQAACKYPRIKSMGISSFGEAFVLLDGKNTVLCNTMLYTDPRGESECEELCKALSKEKILGITGLSPHPMYSISKLMWTKKHRHEIYDSTTRILLIGDYIAYMLTGAAKTDYSLASRTMAFDINALGWSKEIFDCADINIQMMPDIVETGKCVGEIKQEIAHTLGFKGRIKIVACGHDQIAAAVGCGVYEEGSAVDGAGTVECITPLFCRIPNLSEMSSGSYAIVPYLKANRYVCYAFSFTGGALIKWFTDNLAGFAANKAEKKNSSLFSELEGNIPLEKPTGILVLPHFAGAGTPYMDTGSKGAIIGLTLASTQQDIFCALMEGVCYEMGINLERLKKAGISCNKLYATGGGANSKVWLQMKADVLGIPVAVLRSSEAGGTGCAILAGIALGVFQNLEEASAIMIKEKSCYYPRKNMHSEYEKLFKKYKKIYKAVRPLV